MNKENCELKLVDEIILILQTYSHRHNLKTLYIPMQSMNKLSKTLACNAESTDFVQNVP